MAAEVQTKSQLSSKHNGGRHGRDRMLVGFIADVSSNLDQGRCTTLCDKICQRLATGQWFSPGPPISYTNKTVTERHDINEILLKETNKNQNIIA